MAIKAGLSVFSLNLLRYKFFSDKTYIKGIQNSVAIHISINRTFSRPSENIILQSHSIRSVESAVIIS